MRGTNVTLYHYNCPTKGVKKMQTRCRRDAGLTQCRRKTDAEQTQRDAVRTQSRSAQKHGRRRDA